MSTASILCATSLGDASGTIGLAAALARRHRARLELLHVVPTWRDVAWLRPELVAAAGRVRDRAEAEVRTRTARLTAAREALGDAVECLTMVLEGRPHRAIAQTAKALHASHVVVGPGVERWRHAFGGAVAAVGPTTMQVLSESPCPVLVAAGDEAVDTDLDDATWIVGVDAAHDARRLVGHARALAGAGGRVVVLHALGLPHAASWGPQAAAGLEALVKARREELDERLGELEVDLVVAAGDPVPELLACVDRHRARGIVVGREAPASAGTSTLALLQRARVPVLVLAPEAA